MMKSYFIAGLALAAMSCATAPKTVVSVHVEGTQLPESVKLITTDSTYSVALDSFSGGFTIGTATSSNWCTLDFLLGDDDRYDGNDRIWGKDKEAPLDGNIVWGNDPKDENFTFNKSIAPQFGLGNEMSGLIEINTGDEVLIVSGEIINNAM